MKRFKFNYEVEINPQSGEEIILARTKKEAEEIFHDMAESEPHELVASSTPDYPGHNIKVVKVEELDEIT